MRFENVAIASICHIEAPHVIQSSELVRKLGATMDRLGIRRDVFEKVAGAPLNQVNRRFGNQCRPALAESGRGERSSPLPRKSKMQSRHVVGSFSQLP